VKQRSEAGRPQVLDDAKKGEICAILAVGCSRATAARYVGCHPDTIRKTAQRDEEFATALERAESKHEVKNLAFIDQAAKEGKYWRAAAWALERKYPGRYGARRPDLFTAEQMAHALRQFADVILEEVPDAKRREKIMARLAELAASLQSSAKTGADE
jgi:truncated hemoglobin YjbI